MATLWCARILAHLMKVRMRRRCQALVHGAKTVVGVEELEVMTLLIERDVIALTHQLEIVCVLNNLNWSCSSA